MAFNPYYIKPRYPEYRTGYYTKEQMDRFKQSLPNPDAFSAQSFENPEPQQTQRNFNIGNALGVAASSLSSGMESSMAPKGSQAMTGLKAAGEGFLAAGPAGMVAAPLIAGIGQGIATNKYIKGIDTNIDIGSTDEYGNVTYSGGDTIRAYEDIRNLEDLQENASGFQRLFGSRKKAKRKEQELRRSLMASQERFNRANIASEQNYLAQQAYFDKIRGNNPYGIPLNYY